MGWQDKKIQLPDSRIADGVVTINPTTGEPYNTTTGGMPISVVGSSGVEANVDPYGSLRTRVESTALFSDEFDSLDTTNRWTLRTSGGTVTAGNGAIVISGGAAANSWGGIQSQPTFQSIGLNVIEAAGVFMLPQVIIANTKRFWGWGTISTTPTLAVPITNGAGFELDGSGSFLCVVYESGVRTRTVDLTAKRPADNTPFPLIVCRRADALYFYTNTGNKPDAVIPLPGFDVTALPMALISVTGATAPAAAPTFMCSSVGVGDTGCNAGSIKDPTNPFWQGQPIGAWRCVAPVEQPR